ncbi:MAG: DUF4180 domain-containing protein [Eubacteriaceae bacterium]|nr:DUF4180 domain-containing protein [Eubacteriaceae bacterium]
MEIKKVCMNNIDIALIQSDELLLYDINSALDFIATVNYETGCRNIAINKESIAEDFFILSSGLAGEILQKFVNYHIKFAIIGDFSKYSSKALKDFIYECNKGNDIFFVSNEDDAVKKLTPAN